MSVVDVVLFHHVQGLTDGVREFAERLAGETHRVHTPDLYRGAVASSQEEGFEIKNSIGDQTLATRAEQALEGFAPGLVYAGISLGVMTAQQMAQTRPDARGALLYEACLPITGEWAIGPWPEGLAVQVHGMDDDEFFAHEGDLDAAQELVMTVGPAVGELFTYPGNGHLFVDCSLPSYDTEATALVVERSQALLDRLG